LGVSVFPVILVESFRGFWLLIATVGRNPSPSNETADPADGLAIAIFETKSPKTGTPLPFKSQKKEGLNQKSQENT